MKDDEPELLRLEALPHIGAPEPPPGLTPDTFADRLYDALAPIAQLDPDTGFALLIYVNAIGRMFQLVEDWVRDTPQGPGWSLLLDVKRAPTIALPWLGQLAGVRMLPGSSDAEMRFRVVSTDGFRRGTTESIIGAARATLTGNGTVIVHERDHNPADTPDYAYYLSVVTYDAETPDPAATRRAILSQKPAGLVLNYMHVSGQIWWLVNENNTSWQAVKDRYPNWASVKTDQPG